MKIIGHRGAKDLASENTLASFKAALSAGVDELEFDLRVTSDGAVVVNHDPFILDEAGGKRTIATTPLSQLRTHKPDLITFDELLDVVSSKKHLLVEIKPAVNVKPIAQILQKRLQDGWNVATFSICSFDQEVLRNFHALLPEIELVVIESWSSWRARRRARELNTKRISMNQHWLWRGFLRMMHRGGYQISPYTLNNPAKGRRWEPYLYGVITDRPDLWNDSSSKKS
jgi:glycerophosphoryl diester phosphodiesterase